MTTTSIVKGEIPDKASGSESGVDDHAIKFPDIKEAAVRTKVASCCIVFVLDISDAKEANHDKSLTNSINHETKANGALADIFLKESESTHYSVLNFNCAPICD